MKHLEEIYKAENYILIKDYIRDAIKKFAKKDAFILKEKIVKDAQSKEEILNQKENNDSSNKKSKVQEEISYKHITFEEFGKDIAELGTGLIDLGLQGKRISIIGQNSYNWVTSYVSCLYGVGVVVPLDKGLQEKEIIMSLKRSKADAVIFADELAEAMQKIKISGETNIKYFISMTDKNKGFTSLENIKSNGRKLLESGNSKFEEYSPNPDDVASIIFTSGTTSLSKAVMLSNKNIASNIYDMLRAEPIYTSDVNMLFLPLHHAFGSTEMLLFFSNGATSVFCDGLRHIQENLKEYKVTSFVCVPLLLEVMYKNIWKAVEKQGKTKSIKSALKLSNGLRKVGIDIRRKIFKPILNQFGGEIRYVISGAAAISKDVAKGFNDFGILTIQGYGLTETSPVLCGENEKHLRAGSVGLPFPSVEIKIEDKNEQGIGEITAKAPNVMLGYYEMPDETAEVLKDGWFHTGDLGYLDKDGYLFITGRKKNVIVLKNGKNIYPEELEEIIAKLPYVAEVMVFGKDDRDDDLLLSVKIVYDKDYVSKNYPNMSESEFRDIVWEDIKNINKTIPKYKYIKNLILTDEPMIKTTTQKIKRYEEIKKINEESKKEIHN
jgi:long-chain acyl-CoA synthetase